MRPGELDGHGVVAVGGLAGAGVGGLAHGDAGEDVPAVEVQRKRELGAKVEALQVRPEVAKLGWTRLRPAAEEVRLQRKGVPGMGWSRPVKSMEGRGRS